MKLVSFPDEVVGGDVVCTGGGGGGKLPLLLRREFEKSDEEVLPYRFTPLGTPDIAS